MFDVKLYAAEKIGGIKRQRRKRWSRSLQSPDYHIDRPSRCSRNLCLGVHSVLFWSIPLHTESSFRTQWVFLCKIWPFPRPLAMFSVEIVLSYALRKHHKGFQPLKIALFRNLAWLSLTCLTERRKHTQPSLTQRKDQLVVGIGILRQAIFLPISSHFLHCVTSGT